MVYSKDPSLGSRHHEHESLEANKAKAVVADVDLYLNNCKTVLWPKHKSLSKLTSQKKGGVDFLSL